MTWHNIVDGDSGIASTAMDNWKHSGRLAFPSFYPMNGTGAYAIQDLGATGYEWGDIYLALGKQVYINGVPFSGGGAGDILSIIALKIAMEKSANYFVISIVNLLLNSFAVSREWTITLSGNYTTPATTISLTTDSDLDAKLATGATVHFYISDSSNIEPEFISIISGSAGTYTIEALSNSYTTANSAYISTQTGTISGSVQSHKSTVANKAVKTLEVIGTNESSDGDLEALLQFNPTAIFAVASFTDTTTIVLTSVPDYSSWFVSGKKVFLFKKETLNTLVQTNHSSTDKNFKYLTLNAGGSFGSSQITITHDESNAVGADTANWYVITETAYLEYIAGADTANSLTKMTPLELMLSKDEFLIFEDNFNRADGAIVSPWTVYTTGTQGGGYFLKIVSNEIIQYNNSSNSNGTSVITLNNNMSVFGSYKQVAKMRWDSPSDGWSYQQGVEMFKNTTNTTNDGLRVTVDDTYTAVTPDLRIYYAGTQIGTVAVSWARATNYWLEVEYRNGIVDVWFYNVASNRPSTPTLSASVTPVAQIGTIHGIFCKTGATSSRQGYSILDDYSFKNINDAFTIRAKAEGLTAVDQITLVGTNERQSVTTETPELVGIGGTLV